MECEQCHGVNLLKGLKTIKEEELKRKKQNSEYLKDMDKILGKEQN